MSADKILFQTEIMKEIIKSKSILIARAKDDDSVTGIGHELERERGRIEGLQKALELFEKHDLYNIERGWTD